MKACDGQVLPSEAKGAAASTCGSVEGVGRSSSTACMSRALSSPPRCGLSPGILPRVAAPCAASLRRALLRRFNVFVFFCVCTFKWEKRESGVCSLGP